MIKKSVYETFRKRPADATKERALELHETGRLSYAEIGKLWGITAPAVAKLVQRARKNREAAKQKAGV